MRIAVKMSSVGNAAARAGVAAAAAWMRARVEPTAAANAGSA